jgi:hypothetical protein
MDCLESKWTVQLQFSGLMAVQTHLIYELASVVTEPSLLSNQPSRSSNLA